MLEFERLELRESEILYEHFVEFAREEALFSECRDDSEIVVDDKLVVLGQLNVKLHIVSSVGSSLSKGGNGVLCH